MRQLDFDMHVYRLFKYGWNTKEIADHYGVDEAHVMATLIRARGW